MLETPRLNLREWRPEDLAPFAEMNADPEVRRYFPTVHTREESDAEAGRIMEFHRKHGFTFFAAELKATEGARACLEFGFKTRGFPEIVALTLPTNAPSRRVMEKIGMTRDPADDFAHPRLAPDHPMSRHVLYRIKP